MAEWEGDKLTVWTGTQRPFGVRGELAQAFGIPERRVRVIVPDTGSAYGGKHTGEAAIEAARLAKCRRQAGQAGLDPRRRVHLGLLPAGRGDRRRQRVWDATARLTAWEYHNYNSGASGIRTPYDVHEPADRLPPVAAHRCARDRIGRSRRPPITSRANRTWTNWRAALASTRWRFVCRICRTSAPRGARKRRPSGLAGRRGSRRPGRGFGIACGTEKGGYVATCAEVAVDGRAAGARARGSCRRSSAARS